MALNADLDVTPHPPPAPKVIEINDDDAADVSHLPPSLRQTLQYLPKIEPDHDTIPVSVATQPPLAPLAHHHRYPQRSRAPPRRLDDYIFTTIAEQEVDPSYPYTNRSGVTVDLANKNEVMMAHVCHYIMLLTVNKLYIDPPSSPKKQYGLKASLKHFEERGSQAIMKELTQFHTLECFTPKDPKTLFRDDRRKALTSLMFLTEKLSRSESTCLCQQQHSA